MKNDNEEQSRLNSDYRKIRGPRYGKQYIEIADGIVRIFDGYDDCLVYEQPIDHAEFTAWSILEAIAEATGLPITIPVHGD